MITSKKSLKTAVNKVFLSILVSITLLIFTSCGNDGEAVTDKEVHEETHSNLIQLDIRSIEAANLKIEEVSLESLKNIIQVPGKVQFNENKLAHVGSRVSGRIVTVKGNLGDKVKEGDFQILYQLEQN